MADTFSGKVLCDVLSESIAESFYACLGRVALVDENQSVAAREKERRHTVWLLYFIGAYSI
ncbi:hypothetical protein R0J87_16840 [Halomonas sp. SIMBA_159]